MEGGTHYVYAERNCVNCRQTNSVYPVRLFHLRESYSLHLSFATKLMSNSTLTSSPVIVSRDDETKKMLSKFYESVLEINYKRTFLAS